MPDPTPASPDPIMVQTPSATYPVYVGAGLLADLGTLIRPLTAAERVLLVTDSHVGPLYLDAAHAVLTTAGFTVHTHTVPAGEPSKSPDELLRLYTACAEAGIQRRDLLVALGGGVIGDLVGYAAATWLRGVAYVGVPTTCLSQVDSSVGGKTAIDLPEGKNLVGAFKQPLAVIADTETLRTLPDRELHSGMAEVIKYGLIADAAFWERVLHLLPGIPPVDVIRHAITLKAEIVVADELDQGRRAILNFGHSFGHAIEKLEGYGTWTHGEAISVGMVIALRLSEILTDLPPAPRHRLTQWLQARGLPVTTQRSADALITAIRGDKKAHGHALDAILIPTVGHATVVPIPFDDLRQLAPQALEPDSVNAPHPTSNLRFVPPRTLRGPVTPPWSKSLLHRLLIAACLTGTPNWEDLVWPDLTADQESRLSDDIRVTRAALHQLRGASTSGDTPTEPIVLSCGESGTTLRLFVPLAAALGIPVIFKGEGRLGTRPLGELLDQLEAHGITATVLSDAPNTYLPLKIEGTLTPGDYTLPGHISSQYISGLMIALSLLDGPSTLTLSTPLASAPYVALTRDALDAYGVDYTVHDEGFGVYHFPGNQRFTAPDPILRPEADYSQAAFWLVAQFFGSPITVEGLNPSSHQGDRAVMDILDQFRAHMDAPPSDTPLTVDATQIPDVIPILSLAATRVPGTVIFTGADRLKGKESDRLEASLTILRAIGATEAYGTADTLVVPDTLPVWDTDPETPRDCYADHRIAMTLAIAATHSTRGLTLHGSHCVAKSYPDFFEVLDALDATQGDMP